MALDEGILREARLAATHWAEAQRQADAARNAYHRAIRRLYLTGASMREIAEALELSHQRVHQIIEASGGTVGWKPRRNAGAGLACSFCGVPAAEATQVIAGPAGIRICVHCVALARVLTGEVDQRDQPRTHLDPVPATSALGCSFCDRPAGQVGRLVAGPGVRICDGCLEFCAEVLAAQSGESDGRDR